MSRSFRVIPPLATRLAEGRPVLAKEQVTELTQRVMEMTSADTVNVSVSHTAYVITRMANSQVLSGDDGDTLAIIIGTRFGARTGVWVTTNQLDDGVLRTLVRQCEAVARETLGPIDDPMPAQTQVSDSLVPAKLWHEATIRAMTATRGTIIPELLATVTNQQLSASGFLGLMARSEALITKEGISVYSEETDSEVTMTARAKDGTSSGWGGQVGRNWATVNHTGVASRAVEFAKRGVNPVALEPGRRIAILNPAALAQIMRIFGEEYDALDTDQGSTAFSKAPSGNKLGQHLFDPRITMRSDPADPDGGYRPYFASGYGTPVMQWAQDGVLKNLAYNVNYAMRRGKAYAEQPWSIRMSGGTTSVEQMIAQCREGIYVNRFSAVDLVDLRTGMTTGVTRDGCFLIKNGKIDRPLKNFRFLDSPFFFLNNIEAMGVPERAAFGYTPPRPGEKGPTDWPRRPIIVPPIMVRDFNFNALADAV